MPFDVISMRERIRYGSTADDESDGTEYRCRFCQAWSHIDEWTCFGFSEDYDDLEPDFDSVYCGNVAILCPRCNQSQQTPGLIPVQLRFGFDGD